MQRPKRSAAWGAMLAATLVLLGGALPASATVPVGPVVITPADEQASRAFMTEFGVSAETQDLLLDDVRDGKTTLADSGTATPVDVSNFVNDGSEFEVARFADGSISVLEREIPTRVPSGGVSLFSVTGCTVGGSSGYTSYSGCKVHYRTAVFSYGFYSNFTQSGGSATIGSAYGEFQEFAVGHTKDSWTLSIIKKTGNASSPAHVQLAITYNVMPWLGQINKGVRLKVDGSSHWQENS